MIHVRFEGQSLDLDEQRLKVDKGMSDGQLKDRLAEYLHVARYRLRYHMVDRRPSGDVIVHP